MVEGEDIREVQGYARLQARLSFVTAFVGALHVQFVLEMR